MAKYKHRDPLAWGIILIVIGFIFLLYNINVKISQQSGLTMKAKEIIVLILIIGAGIFFYHAQTGKLNIDWQIDGHFLFNYEEFSYEETQQIEAPLPQFIKINNAHGQVEVQGGQEGKVTIIFQKNR